MKSKAILSLSGGLDSTTLLYHLVKDLDRDVLAVSFEYGQNHSKEVEFAEYHCKALGVPLRRINLKDYYDNINHSSTLQNGSKAVSSGSYEGVPDTYVSYRNLLFTITLASIAEEQCIDEIYLGLNRVDRFDGYWDTSEEFVAAVQAILNLNPSTKAKLITPFVNMTKADEVLIGSRLGIDYSRTMSCYRGENCGDCATCIERIDAFTKAKVEDGIKYV